MPTRGRGSPVVVLLGLVAFGAAVAWFGIVRPQGSGHTASSPLAAPANGQDSPPTTAEPEAGRPQQTPAQRPAEAADAPRGQAGHPAPVPTAPEPMRIAAAAESGKAQAPSFDVVRIEPNGESVIAGRGAPGATVEMLRNGRSHGRALADTSGLFAFVPPPLAPGSHEIGLTSIAPDGTRAQSRESVTVVISEDRARKPLVTLASPDRPTVVLSTPDAPEAKKPAAPEAQAVDASAILPEAPAASVQAAPPGPGPQPPAPRPGVKIVSVEAEEGGRLFVSGDAAAGATIRLYLNDSFIAPGGTGHDGRVSFAIGRGVRPGDYRVRLDDVDPVSGDVKSRAEVAFNVPAPFTVPLPPHAEPLPEQPEMASSVARLAEPLPDQAPEVGPTPSNGSLAKAPGQPVPSSPQADSGSASSPARGIEPGTVIVPQITTATVSRGDNLWRISRRIYGHGTRYTVIYDANQTQIRNPDRIYPGQIFVLPAGQAPGETSRAEP